MTLLEFIENLAKFGLEFFGRYYSFYPAQVTNTNDPEQRGRIRVKIPTLFNDELAQWVMPLDNEISGSNRGKFFPPYVNDWVQVKFDHGDLDYPYYIGGYWAKNELPSDFKSSYGDVRGWVFKSGQKILVDEKSNKISILNKNGSSFVLDDSGKSVKLTDANGSVVEMKSDGTISVAAKDGFSTVLGSGKIVLGKGGTLETAVAGDTLKEMLDMLLNTLVMHVHPAPGAPTTQVPQFKQIQAQYVSNSKILVKTGGRF